MSENVFMLHSTLLIVWVLNLSFLQNYKVISAIKKSDAVLIHNSLCVTCFSLWNVKTMFSLFLGYSDFMTVFLGVVLFSFIVNDHFNLEIKDLIFSSEEFCYKESVSFIISCPLFLLSLELLLDSGLSN